MPDRPDDTTSRPRCHWVREPDGVQWLVPGCMTRMFEPDVEGCDCSLLADELAAARTQHQSARDAACGSGWTTSSLPSAITATAKRS